MICLKIACALIGSLGALYNGITLVNLGIGLFALVAIESSSQSLGRTYAALLFSAILLDILWFIFFSQEIWLAFSLIILPLYSIFFLSSVSSKTVQFGTYSGTFLQRFMENLRYFQ